MTALQNERATCWCRPPKSLRIANTEIHVWRSILDRASVHVQRFEQALSADELARANAFCFERDRSRWIIARGVLRHILGRYLGVNASEVRLAAVRLEDVRARNKPTLADEFRGGWLRFNVSHSHGLALYAITTDREIGIDIERIIPGQSCERIAERVCSAREMSILRALPEGEREDTFLTYWARKEAYAKATGEGLTLSFDQVDVSAAPGRVTDPAAASADICREWLVYDLAPRADYVGAVVTTGEVTRLRLWDWLDEFDVRQVGSARRKSTLRTPRQQW